MRNFKFIISYDSSRYFGWERQPGRDTIQGKLEAVLTRMCGTEVNVIGAAARTQAFTQGRWRQRLYGHGENAGGDPRLYEPVSCRTISAWMRWKLAADRFHARYRAVGKLYIPTPATWA